MPGAADVAAWPSRELRLRTLSALVLAPVALAALWVGGAAWTVLVALVAVVLAAEWAGLSAQAMTTRGRLATALAGVPYVGCAVAGLLYLRADPAFGRWATLFVVLIVWGSDVGAYVFGRWLGGPRLAPAISPGKTWSGAVGGLVAAVAVGALVVALAGDAPGAGSLAVAATLAVASQAGDLLESWIKRLAGVKDSGHLIPGHGGAFDRLDGLLVAAPLAAVLAWVAGPGVPVWGVWR